jgi:hypothetical protein
MKGSGPQETHYWCWQIQCLMLKQKMRTECPSSYTMLRNTVIRQRIAQKDEPTGRYLPCAPWKQTPFTVTMLKWTLPPDLS